MLLLSVAVCCFTCPWGFRGSGCSGCGCGQFCPADSKSGFVEMKVLYHVMWFSENLFKVCASVFFSVHSASHITFTSGLLSATVPPSFFSLVSPLHSFLILPFSMNHEVCMKSANRSHRPFHRDDLTSCNDPQFASTLRSDPGI